jgi:hypothetical protein
MGASSSSGVWTYIGQGETGCERKSSKQAGNGKVCKERWEPEGLFVNVQEEPTKRSSRSHTMLQK